MKNKIGMKKSKNNHIVSLIKGGRSPLLNATNTITPMVVITTKNPVGICLGISSCLPSMVKNLLSIYVTLAKCLTIKGTPMNVNKRNMMPVLRKGSEVGCKKTHDKRQKITHWKMAESIIEKAYLILIKYALTSI